MIPGLKADIVGLAKPAGKLVMEHLLQIGRTGIAYAGAPKGDAIYAVNDMVAIGVVNRYKSWAYAYLRMWR